MSDAPDPELSPPARLADAAIRLMAEYRARPDGAGARWARQARTEGPEAVLANLRSARGRLATRLLTRYGFDVESATWRDDAEPPATFQAWLDYIRLVNALAATHRTLLAAEAAHARALETDADAGKAVAAVVADPHKYLAEFHQDYLLRLPTQLQQILATCVLAGYLAQHLSLGNQRLREGVAADGENTRRAFRELLLGTVLDCVAQEPSGEPLLDGDRSLRQRVVQSLESERSLRQQQTQFILDAGRRAESRVEAERKAGSISEAEAIERLALVEARTKKALGQVWQDPADSAAGGEDDSAPRCVEVPDMPNAAAAEFELRDLARRLAARAGRSEQQERIWLLRVQDPDLTNIEIAERLGTTPDTVGVQLFRALKKLAPEGERLRQDLS